MIFHAHLKEKTGAVRKKHFTEYLVSYYIYNINILTNQGTG